MIALYYCNTTDNILIQYNYRDESLIKNGEVYYSSALQIMQQYVPHQSEHGIDVTEDSAGSHCLQKPEGTI